LAEKRRPNLIWIMADDLGYGELGCYGQKSIRTPNLDLMANEGMRFTRFYAGATVCAPSRSVLMTGLHQGHTRVRGNAKSSLQALQEGDVTVADVLKQAGYQTALIGKWGLGDVGGAEAGLPRKHGFASFYGYLNQDHAHNHFPDFLWRNETKEALRNDLVPTGTSGAGYATEPRQYADDLFADEAIRFVSDAGDQPFFLYWSMIVPHANNERTLALGDGAEVPDSGTYANEADWSPQNKGHSAMITRLDGYVGRMMKKLRETGLAENTLVVFTSDNGPHDESGHDLSKFSPSGPYTGIKRSLTDGGIRVPFIAWWPGTVQAGSVSSRAAYFPDWFSTAADLADVAAPKNLDGISLAPVFRGGEQRRHEFLYWEFHEKGFAQAALYQDRWKGIRSGGADAPIKLFDQQHDVSEQKNVAAENPEIVATINRYLQTARTPLEGWEPVWKSSDP